MKKYEKINIHELCANYNKALNQNKGKKFTSSEVKDVLKSFGISGSMIKRIIANEKLLISFKYEGGVGKGNYRGYKFPDNPVFEEWFRNWLYPKKVNYSTQKPLVTHDEALQTLIDDGTVVVTLDINELKSKYPNVWLACLRYEFKSNIKRGDNDR